MNFKIKRNHLDGLVTKAVRLREKNICQRCGKYVTGQNSHAAHIMKRRNKTTRYYMPNIFHLCFNCHRWGHSEETAFKAWVKSVIGDEAYRNLELMARETWDKDEFKWKIYLEAFIRALS